MSVTKLTRVASSHNKYLTGHVNNVRVDEGRRKTFVTGLISNRVLLGCDHSCHSCSEPWTRCECAVSAFSVKKKVIFDSCVANATESERNTVLNLPKFCYIKNLHNTQNLLPNRGVATLGDFSISKAAGASA